MCKEVVWWLVKDCKWRGEQRQGLRQMQQQILPFGKDDNQKGKGKGLLSSFLCPIFSMAYRGNLAAVAFLMPDPGGLDDVVDLRVVGLPA